MKKLTLLVPDDLHRAVKAAVASRGDTMTRIVIDAFQSYLAEPDAWAKWDIVLEKARRHREAQRARRGEWQGPDIATLIEEDREQRAEQIEYALSGR
jgi:hypothetical protein